MNSFGHNLRLSIFGESHGNILGITIDGCLAGINLKPKDFDKDLLRRKTGAKGTSTRIEQDIPEIISGVFKNKTTGTPITIIFENKNQKPSDYKRFTDVLRPGHSDFTANKKFNGFNDHRGGGHFSGRLTLGLVAAGVIAKKIIPQIKISAKVTKINGSKNLSQEIDKAIELNDSVGAIIECSAKNIPVGLGEPFFNSVESVISHYVFSIPGIKGIEFGKGFDATKMYGSEFNDLFIDKSGKTKTNNSGGINGGITNGNDLFFRVAVRPTASISKAQETLNFKTGKIEKLKISGRHDVCFALRVPVIIEAVTALSLADFYLEKL